MNWVEIRALREKSLLNNSVEFWQEIVTAVEECCTSFNEYYSNLGSARHRTANGHRLLVTITRANVIGQAANSVVAIDFNREESHVDVTVDARTTQVFPLGADETKVYLVANHKPINVDDFTKLILEKPLFDSGSVK